MEVECREGEYNGHPLLEFWDITRGRKNGDRRMFRMGLKKCTVVLAMLGAVEKYVKKYGGDGKYK